MRSRPQTSAKLLLVEGAPSSGKLLKGERGEEVESWGRGPRMGSPVISHFDAPPPPAPRKHTRPVPSSLQGRRTFTDTATESGAYSPAGGALFYKLMGKLVSRW